MITQTGKDQESALPVMPMTQRIERRVIVANARFFLSVSTTDNRVVSLEWPSNRLVQDKVLIQDFYRSSQQSKEFIDYNEFT